MRDSSFETAEQLGSVASRYSLVPSVWAQALRPVQASFGCATTNKPTAFESQSLGTVEEKTKRVEAVLFLAREPLNSRKLSQYADLVDGTEARTIVKRLNSHYDEHCSAFRVEQVAGGFQLLTRPQFANWLRRFEHTPRETRLSAPAMETLAVVTYRQPVLRADIEAIRGVNCGEILRQLMERDLVRISGRSEELGRPYLYATTKLFLQTFGLENLDKLPRADVLRNAAIPNRTQPSEASPQSEDELQLSEIEEQS